MATSFLLQAIKIPLQNLRIYGTYPVNY